MLVPCPQCRRHIRDESARCPFCATRIARPSTTVMALGTALLIAGCGHATPAPQEPAASVGIPAATTPAPSAVQLDAAVPEAAPEPAASSEPVASSAPPPPEPPEPIATATPPSNPGRAAVYGPPPRRDAPVYGPPPSEEASATMRDRDSIKSVFEKARSRLRSCWKDGAQGQGGRVTLRVTIARDGKVTKAETSGSTLPRQVDQCVVVAAKTLRFGPAANEVTVSYPLAFVP